MHLNYLVEVSCVPAFTMERFYHTTMQVWYRSLSYVTLMASLPRPYHITIRDHNRALSVSRSMRSEKNRDSSDDWAQSQEFVYSDFFIGPCKALNQVLQKSALRDPSIQTGVISYRSLRLWTKQGPLLCLLAYWHTSRSHRIFQKRHDKKLSQDTELIHD